MNYSFTPSGVCSRNISFELREGRVYNVRFTGGCNGNAKGISSLVEGMTVDEVIKRLQGITCGMKSSSCPDQLSIALKKAKQQ